MSMIVSMIVGMIILEKIDFVVGIIVLVIISLMKGLILVEFLDELVMKYDVNGEKGDGKISIV